MFRVGYVIGRAVFGLLGRSRAGAALAVRTLHVADRLAVDTDSPPLPDGVWVSPDGDPHLVMHGRCSTCGTGPHR